MLDKNRQEVMSLKELDFIFPFVIFGYGFIATFIFNHPKFLALAEKRLPFEYHQQFRARRTLGAICLVVGGLWTLQNLWMR